MNRYLAWWLARLICGAAAWVLVPLSLGLVFITKHVRHAESNADIELLRATARLRITRQTKGTHS